MFKKLIALFVLCALHIVTPARADLKVDIVAGATNPISGRVMRP